MNLWPRPEGLVKQECAPMISNRTSPIGLDMNLWPRACQTYQRSQKRTSPTGLDMNVWPRACQTRVCAKSANDLKQD